MIFGNIAGAEVRENDLDSRKDGGAHDTLCAPASKIGGDSLLTLPIKRKWFDMIVSGEKQDEYREISPYWQKRFSTAFGAPAAQSILTKKHCVVCFRNGYTKDRPSILALVSLQFGAGLPEWGAEPGKNYFKLHIHDFVWEVKP